TGVFLNLGYRYYRYFSNQSEDLTLIGSLYSMNQNAEDYTSFDSYSLPDPKAKSPLYQKPNKELGGSFPSYDYFQVSAQGLGGIIQPYILENGYLSRQNEIEYHEILKGERHVSYFIKYNRTNKEFTKKVNFRFKNDFSNSYVRNIPGISIAPDEYGRMK